jgi:dephospho-CoA kinase
MSADAVVHELYARPDVRAALREHFGVAVFSADGTVDRRALGACVAADREGLRWLEGVVHPLVALEFERVLTTVESSRVVVIEIPLLFESRLQRLFDLVVTVEAPRELRTARATARDDSRVFDVLDAEQLSTEQRLSASDIGYVNDGDLERLRGCVAEVMARAAALWRAPKSREAVS